MSPGVGGVQSCETTPALLTAPGFLARRLYQAYLAVWLREVGSSLTGPQFAVLTQVAECPGVDQRSLASLVSLDTSTMADIAHRLETKGLLRRAPDTDDGRRKLLYLTADGEAVLADTTGLASTLDLRLLEPFPGGQAAAILADLTVLAEHWERLGGSSVGPGPQRGAGPASTSATDTTLTRGA